MNIKSKYFAKNFKIFMQNRKEIICLLLNIRTFFFLFNNTSIILVKSLACKLVIFLIIFNLYAKHVLDLK